jgi:hypothetical protein
MDDDLVELCATGEWRKHGIDHGGQFFLDGCWPGRVREKRRLL